MCPLLLFKDIVGLQWQEGFEPFSQFAINVSQQNFQKENMYIAHFVHKVKINRSRFFPHATSWGISQKTSIWGHVKLIFWGFFVFLKMIFVLSLTLFLQKNCTQENSLATAFLCKHNIFIYSACVIFRIEKLVSLNTIVFILLFHIIWTHPGENP